MQSVEKQGFAQPSSSKGLVHGQPTQVDRRDGMLGQFLANGLRQATKVERTGGQSIITSDARLAWFGGDKGAAQAALLVLTDQRGQKSVELRLSTAKRAPIVRRAQSLDDPVSHGTS